MKKKAKIRTRRNDRAFTIQHPDGRTIHFGPCKKDGSRDVSTQRPGNVRTI